MYTENKVFQICHALSGHIFILDEMSKMSKTTKKSYSEMIKRRPLKSILRSSKRIAGEISKICNTKGLKTSSSVKEGRGSVDGNWNTIKLPIEEKRYYTLAVSTPNGRVHADTYLQSIEHIAQIYTKYFEGRPNPFEACSLEEFKTKHSQLQLQ